MNRAKFTLEHLFYPTASVKANYQFKRNSSEGEPNGPVVKIYATPRDNSHELQLGLSIAVAQESEADPYDIDLFVIGYFAGDDSISAKEAVEQIIISGPNILYGAARERIMTMTSLSAWGEYILPAVTFDPSDFEPAPAKEQS